MTLDALLTAVYRRDVTALRSASREDVNQTDEDGRTPLMHAVLAEDADPAVVGALLERGADPDVADGGQHWTASHFAARDEDVELVRQLLDAGAATDPVDVFGNTPLWRAVFEAGDDTRVIALLLERAADPRRENGTAVSPLGLAAELGRADLVELLERASPT